VCGIAGFLAPGAPPADGVARLKRMAQWLAHRGPDGEGTFVSGKVGLAHRRLAVIDLTERAAQPMQTQDGQITCTFNGEIYNFQALRTELQALGHAFVSDSDTEVLLHGYRAWGRDLLPRLHGMFAFAIWDHQAETLFLARDRFGKKPLYFTWTGGDFVFASEQKALLTWPGFERRANLSAIHDYLSFKFTMGNATAFEGIEKLLPGHALLLTRAHHAGHRPEATPFWQVPPAPSEPQAAAPACEADLQATLFEKFDNAIAKRLISDVPVGAFLSGGVDSTAVVARAAKMRSEPLKTFSAGFGHDGFDETEYAHRIATQFGTDHRSFTMDEGLAAELPDLVWNYSDPFADSSALITTALAREVRKHVTVALSGDGGDEVFLGYQRYKRFGQEVSKPSHGLHANALDAHLRRLFGPIGAKDIYARSLVAFRDIHKEWGYGPALAPYLFSPSADRLPDVLEEAQAGTAVACAGLADMASYLPDDLMVKTDIASMACGLEARCPFLDHDLAEWAASLPEHVRVFERDGTLEMKGFLKRALEPQIDADILYRTKMGFRVPIARWLRGQLKDLAFDLLTSRSFQERGLFRPQFIDWMLEAHVSGREDHSTRLWALVVLELWFRTFIDRMPDGPIALPLAQTSGVLDEVHAP
jgi:asparagine synthase (glutamine-hydrolysing)